MTVGTKQLKNQLSYYLRRVPAGEVVKVTDRGRIVAELREATGGGSNEEDLLQELDVAGLVTAGTGRLRDFKPVRLRAEPSHRPSSAKTAGDPLPADKPPASLISTRSGFRTRRERTPPQAGVDDP